MLVAPPLFIITLTMLPLSCSRAFVSRVHTPDSVPMQLLGPMVAPFR